MGWWKQLDGALLSLHVLRSANTAPARSIALVGLPPQSTPEQSSSFAAICIRALHERLAVVPLEDVTCAALCLLSPPRLVLRVFVLRRCGRASIFHRATLFSDVDSGTRDSIGLLCGFWIARGIGHTTSAQLGQTTYSALDHTSEWSNRTRT